MSKGKGGITSTARSGGRAVTQQTVIAQEPIMLPLATREVDTLGTMALGLRQNFFELTDKGEVVAAASSGAGLGSLWIQFEYRGRHMVMNAGEILVAWVRTFDPTAADEMAKAVKP